MNDQIDVLIAKFLAGETNSKEDKELEKWLNFSDENRVYFSQMKNIWHSHKKVTISEDAAFNMIRHRVIPKSVFREIWIYWQRIAAILIIPVLIIGAQSIFSKKIKHHEGETITFQEVATPFGAFTSFILPDSSKVWLNSGSKLKYPVKFNGDNRIVNLEGEAYFEVKSDEQRPFIVNTKKFNVRATGTKFNVRAYSNHKSQQVALVTGKVSVSRKNENTPVRINLKPNDVLNFNDDHSNIHSINEDIYKCYAWKDGKLVFRNDPFDEVARRMSIQYNADIELKGEKLKQYSFRATFKSETLDEVLNLLKLTSPFVYRQHSPRLLPDGSYSRKKIIISSM